MPIYYLDPIGDLKLSWTTEPVPGGAITPNLNKGVRSPNIPATTPWVQDRTNGDSAVCACISHSSLVALPHLSDLEIVQNVTLWAYVNTMHAKATPLTLSITNTSSTIFATTPVQSDLSFQWVSLPYTPTNTSLAVFNTMDYALAAQTTAPNVTGNNNKWNYISAWYLEVHTTVAARTMLGAGI